MTWQEAMAELRRRYVPRLDDDAPGDAMRDALALIEAVHRGDLEGGRVLLDNTNLRLTAAGLARIAADLIECWLLEDDPDVFARIRRHYTAG
jgi:hypothetical protein